MNERATATSVGYNLSARCSKKMIDPKLDGVWQEAMARYRKATESERIHFWRWLLGGQTEPVQLQDLLLFPQEDGFVVIHLPSGLFGFYNNMPFANAVTDLARNPARVSAIVHALFRVD